MVLAQGHVWESGWKGLAGKGQSPVIMLKSGFLTHFNAFQGLRRVTIGEKRGKLRKPRVKVGFKGNFGGF